MFVASKQLGITSSKMDALYMAGLTAAWRGDRPAAMAYLVEDLSLASLRPREEAFVPLLHVALGFSFVLAGDGDFLRAAELLALAMNKGAVIPQYIREFPVFPRLRSRLESELGGEDFEAAWERG